MKINKIAALLAATLVLTACSKEETVDYTEAENALQASLVGYWTDDLEQLEQAVAEEKSAVSVLEFTDNYSYLWHECNYDNWQIITYEPTKYSFEELNFKIDNYGEKAYAKLETSADGNTLYWITDDNTYDYTRVPQELIDKIGIESGKAYETEGTDKPVKDGPDYVLEGNTSPSGYVLDPMMEYVADIDYENHAVLIAETGGTRIYGVCPEGKEQLVITEGNGLIQEFKQDWMTPRAIMPKAEYIDADGDGEDELVAAYYVGSGSGISIEELVVYKADEDGILTAHKLDAAELIDEYINYQIDNDNLWLDFAAYDTSEIYSTSIKKDYPDGIESISFGNTVSYKLEDGKIEIHTKPDAKGLRYECMPEIVARVVFDGKDFELEYIDFRKAE